jgi:hypothetical protein
VFAQQDIVSFHFELLCTGCTTSFGKRRSKSLIKYHNPAAQQTSARHTLHTNIQWTCDTDSKALSQNCGQLLRGLEWQQCRPKRFKEVIAGLNDFCFT